METLVKYRGRCVSRDDVETIKKVIEDFPGSSRRFISQELCRIWDWRQPNGYLKDMVCRSLLLLLESSGFIKLPPRKCTPNNPLANRKKPEKIVVDETPLQCKLSDISISLIQVRKTSREKMFDSLVEQYHYLGYTQPVGEHLKYLAFHGDRPLACLARASAPWHIKARDRFIGWTKRERQKNLHLIASNTRFPILPWIRIQCLASRLLSISRKNLSEHWNRLYNHPVYLVETFVDVRRFSGTCYRADNWIQAGLTTGRGKANKTHVRLVSKKAVFVRPLRKNFRKKLRDAAQGRSENIFRRSAGRRR